MPSGESAKVVVKLRVNMNGIFSVCSAVIADKDAKENINLDQRSEDLMDLKVKNSDGPSEPIVNEVRNIHFNLLYICLYFFFSVCIIDFIFVNFFQEKKTFFSLKKHKKIPQEIELQVEPKVPQLSESELKTFMESEVRPTFYLLVFNNFLNIIRIDIRKDFFNIHFSFK